MTVIEHDVYECPDCGAIGWHTRTCGMFPGEMVDAGNRVKVVRAIEHRGAVDALRYCADYRNREAASRVAQDALAAMGIDPATPQGGQ